MNFKTLDDMDLAGKVVLTRVDINVPVEDGHVTDTTRIDRILPTLRDIQAAGGKVVMLAHFGRPKGKVVPEMSLRQVVPALSQALGQDVAFIERPDRATIDATDGPILIENTRFSPMEEANDPMMSKFLASLGDVYCNDAFSAAHRAHASTEGIAHLLPACAGRSMEAELKALEAALGKPKPPVAAVVGGAKVSSKLDLLGNLVGKVQHLIIGGGMANTFLAAQGVDVQKSLCEHDLLDTARQITAKAEAAGCAILLPNDVVVAKEFRADPPTQTVKADEVPAGYMILDAGPDSVAHIKTVLDGCATLVWNGPLGAFEMTPFDAATVAAARHAAELTKAGKLISVAGGGDTVSALNHAGVATDFTYISTAGGAFLEWMEGKVLPGVAALSDH
ncbi:phosphoglycerate kinase [Jannaschia faecimaris]|uniref:Phosphoglycerate kinase n=1 Tax=Jannaschia faecimaris TaxID=1244108 RepID=A0A1H3S0F7_9RHOB|nr:phosphoglycerate kinase [Jannaschia faecimaris]SDZ31128.1 phosphoglycerate kinase [Jannaschia faecimaris]